MISAVELFLSTPSARRATALGLGLRPREIISIHALREEGDPFGAAAPSTTNRFLSTPSARRATIGIDLGLRNMIFLSTPSARRATALGLGLRPREIISIHALREEGDEEAVRHRLPEAISIHALREEGDCCRSCRCCWMFQFLSTPSARRATDRHPTHKQAQAAFLSTPSARRATYNPIGRR